MGGFMSEYLAERRLLSKMFLEFVMLSLFMPKTQSQLEMAAVGRPFHIGSLYDQKNDEILGGGAFLLWSVDTLKKNTNTTVFPGLVYEAVVSRNFERNYELLGVDASLEVALRGGKITGKGSAKYLKLDDLSNFKATVGLIYQQTLFWNTITDLHVPVDYKSMFTIFPQASHVVTGILYGGSAVFKFEKTVHNKDQAENLTGTLAVSLNLASINVSGSINISMADVDNKNLTDFQCEFNGNVDLDMVPINFKSAMTTLGQIPKKISDKSRAIPIKVMLTEIHILEGEAERMVREINAQLLLGVVYRYNRYSDLRIRLNDLFMSSAYEMILIVKNHIDHFMVAFDAHKSGFDSKLLQILPLVRAENGSKAEDKLESAVNNEGNYSMESLEYWIESKKQETHALSMICETNPFIFLLNTAAKRAIVWNPTYTYILIFSLKIYHEMDLFTRCVQNNSSPFCNGIVQYRSWVADAMYLRQKFGEFLKSTKMIVDAKRMPAIDETFEFAIAIDFIKEDEQPNGALEFYVHGVLVERNLTFPAIKLITAKFQKCNRSLLVSWIYEYTKSVVVPENLFVLKYQLSYKQGIKNITGPWNPITGIFSPKREIQKHFQDQDIEIEILKVCIYGYCARATKKVLIEDKIIEEEKCQQADYNSECEYKHGVDIVDGSPQMYNPFESSPEVFATPYACCFGCAREENSIGFSYIISNERDVNAGTCYCKYGNLIATKENRSSIAGVIKPLTFP